jgi:HTH-type transcriptional repressor of NAD biosynthesis genes
MHGFQHGRKVLQNNILKGFYGGGFNPPHEGHAYCIRSAETKCDELFVIMFVNQEVERDEWHGAVPCMSVEARAKKLCAMFARSTSKLYVVPDNGNWDDEARGVRKIIGGNPDVVFSSEPSYDSIFKRLYPKAHHILIDPERQKYHISSTEIRAKYCAESKSIS